MDLRSDILTKSENFRQEYCCTIVRIGEVTPIPTSDFLGKVEVEGRIIVVRKDTVKEKDVLLYVSNECEVNEDFLKVNNLYEDSTMNDDHSRKGYINKYGRIRMVKLRGELSMGILFSKEDIARWKPEIGIVDLSEHIGEDFDTVAGTWFVKPYIPRIKENTHVGLGTGVKSKQMPKLDRLIPGEFLLHYETSQLNRNIDRLHPTDIVDISVKMHGTSIVIGNVLTLQPRWKGLYTRVFNHLPKFLQFTKKAYDVIYSSRKIVKNKFYNPKDTPQYYKNDIWGEYYLLLKDYIPEGVTIYGEIVGYVSDTNTMIQKDYDYGCNVGHNKLVIYRITDRRPDAPQKEYSISAVLNFTERLIEFLKYSDPGAAKRIMPLPVLYHGCISNLYPYVRYGEDWNANILEELKKDVSHFGMEQDEPLCYKKVAREGICLRIEDDPIPECFKLKTLRFLDKEAKMIDKGEVDMEMTDGFSEN